MIMIEMECVVIYILTHNSMAPTFRILVCWEGSEGGYKAMNLYVISYPIRASGYFLTCHLFDKKISIISQSKSYCYILPLFWQGSSL